MPTDNALSRRSALKLGAASAAFTMPFINPARAADTLGFATWSAAVDEVKAHLGAFEKETGIATAYSNAPFAQYRDTMVAKFTGGAPVDLLWMSDAWLPEFAQAGWIAPIDHIPEVTAYNAVTSDFCTASLMYQGKQYGLTYYTDYMGFLYNEELLAKAGFAAPPTTWDEVTSQAAAIKAKGLLDYPVVIGMAAESWQIEFISALVFSHGGRLVDDAGKPVMAEAGSGATAALGWLADAVQTHKILSPGCVQTGELEVLKAASAGRAAFVLLPKYRLRVLNDTQQSQVAGKFKQALMPMGPSGSHATVGWIRFYGVTPHALATPERARASASLMEWFAGKADGDYRFPKILVKDLALGFGITSLFDDPEVRRDFASYGDPDLMASQQKLARKKDTIAPWFGEWNDTNGTAWQQAVLGRTSVGQALKTSASKWTELKAAG